MDLLCAACDALVKHIWKKLANYGVRAAILNNSMRINHFKTSGILEFSIMFDTMRDRAA